MGAGERRLGCLLFAASASAWALAARDQWVGWTARARAQRLTGVVANTRFLLFPWVTVKNLASTAHERPRRPIAARGRAHATRARREAQRCATRDLRLRQTAQGLAPRPTATIANGMSAWATVADERQARQAAIDKQVKVYRAMLP